MGILKNSKYSSLKIVILILSLIPVQFDNDNPFITLPETINRFNKKVLSNCNEKRGSYDTSALPINLHQQGSGYCGHRRGLGEFFIDFVSYLCRIVY